MPRPERSTSSCRTCPTFFRENPAAPLLTGLTAAFNNGLGPVLDALDATLPIKIVQFNTAAAVANIVNNPGAFDLTNVTESCVANLLNGRCDPNTWFFWDDVHPTTRAHEILGLQFAQAVPEPAPLALLAIALAVLGFIRRRVTPTTGLCASPAVYFLRR